MGGGFYITFGGEVQLVRSTITGNIATGEQSVGGGLYARNNAPMLITDSTISGNAATLAAGGIRLSTAVRSLRVERSTITDNRANSAAGVLIDYGQIDLTNSVIAGNYLPDGRESSIGRTSGGTVHVQFSVLGTSIESGLAEAPLNAPDTNGNLIGGPVHGVIDPLLAPLADNGGPTLPGGARLLTHALLPGSPALDAGNPAFVLGFEGASEFDGRGAPFTRLAGPRVDIGAFEAQSPVGALTADFDFNGHTDGLDFLTWQRHFGRTTAATFRQGDATANATVDTSDYQVWAARFGDQPAPATASSASATAITSTALSPPSSSALILPPPSPERGGAGGGATALPVSTALLTRRAGERLAPTYAPAARTAFATDTPPAFVPAARASAFDELVADELDSAEPANGDFVLAIHDEALSCY